MKIERNNRNKRKSKVVLVTAALGLCLFHPTAFAEFSSGHSVTMSGSAAATASSVPETPDFPQPAEPKITKDEAVAQVRSLFPKLKDVKVEDIQLGNHNSFPPGNQNVWNIQWNYSKGNSSYGFSSTVDSLTGELLQTSINYPMEDNGEVYYPAKVSKTAALSSAKAFIEKAAPSVSLASLLPSEQMEYFTQPLFGPVRYDFNFSIPVNGIKSTNEAIYLSLDGNGQVISYSRNTLNAAYPSAVPKVTVQEADKKYEAATELTLQYVPLYNYNAGIKQWFLGWAPLMLSDLSLDAQTGDFLNGFGDVVQPNDVKYTTIPKTDGAFTPIAGKGDDSLLTVEQAVAVVEQTASIPGGRKLSYSNLNDDYGSFSGVKNRKIWRISWAEQPSGQPFGKQTNATIDARTGQILDFSLDSAPRPWADSSKNTEPPKQLITKEQAQDKAMQLINRMYPNAGEELNWVNPDLTAMYKDSNSSFPFLFQRVYKGIPVTGDTTMISLDASGQLLSYRSSRADNLEDAAKAIKANITKEKAMSEYLNKTSEMLQYRSFGGFYTGSDYEKPVVKLVYSRVNKDQAQVGYVLDAADGHWRPTFVNPSVQADGPVVLPQDIAGHWAQKDLETMVQYQILKPDPAAMLQPDAPITLGDWMNMMAFAVNPQYANNNYYAQPSDNSNLFQDVDNNSPYFAAAKWFVNNQWLDPAKTPQLKPEQPLTRERLAVSLMSIVKYDKLSGLIRLASAFKDADQIKNKGAVSLAVELGFFSGDTAMFHPLDKVSKAQAATILMKLVHLQGKTDQRFAP